MSDTITPRFKVGDPVRIKPTDSSFPNLTGTVTNVYLPGEEGGSETRVYFRFDLDVPQSRKYSDDPEEKPYVHTNVGRCDHELC